MFFNIDGATSHMSTTRELTLHVGLPKTATTTLQKHVFPRHPGYLGRWIGDPRRSAGQEWQLFREARRRWQALSPGWECDLGAWAASLETDRRQSLLLSDEILSAWPMGGSKWPLDGQSAGERQGRPPLAQFLAALRAELGDHWNVRVILTVRSQPEFIGSFYAELNRLSTGQEHFETSVIQALRDSAAFFDWASLVDAVESELSTQNLLVLVHEDGLEHNVHSIGKFLACDLSLPAGEAPRENAKTVGRHAWKTVPPGPLPATTRGLLGAARRALARRWPESLKPVAGALRRILHSVDAVAASVIHSQAPEGVAVSMPVALSVAIRNRFEESNRRLGKRLGRDLTPHDY